MKKLLFIGDVVGEAGCDFLRANLRRLKREHGADIAIVNGENSAQGNGITPHSADSLINAGADMITTGNHAFRRKEALSIFERDCILRPANYPEGAAPGSGIRILDMGAYSVAVLNIMGTAYMDPLDNPFTTADNLLRSIPTPNVILDFHAEATAEKKAMGHYLAGRVTAVIGTHTHVQTADETILAAHTAYITDAGMTGAEHSCLGVEIQPAIDRFRFRTPVKFTEAAGACFLCGVCIEFDEKTGKSHKIDRIIVR